MPIRTLIIAALVASALSGCGRRGALEDAGIPETAPEQQAGPAVFGGFLPSGAELDEPPQPGPQRRFILDPLL